MTWLRDNNTHVNVLPKDHAIRRKELALKRREKLHRDISKKEDDLLLARLEKG